MPALDDPQRFTELVQWRKLHDRDARMPALADKVRVKRFVENALGRDWVIPTLWSGPVMPAAFDGQGPYVVKSRHGCNQIEFVRAEPADYRALRRRADRWAERPYGAWLDEWLYAEIPRGLLIEPYVGEADALPIDYKIYVFGGRAAYVQVHLGRGRRHRWIVFDRDWRRVSAPSSDPDPAPPRALAVMIDAAETLGRDFDFVRVDLYDLATGPKFGEMTFYPGSGLDRFDPVSLDADMGALWRRAMAGTPLAPAELTGMGGLLPATA